MLQGNLQTVFDALYHLGVIDPVLEKDWTKELERLEGYRVELDRVVQAANSKQNDLNGLVAELGQFDNEILSFLAMEVAREFADFHMREQLH